MAFPSFGAGDAVRRNSCLLAIVKKHTVRDIHDILKSCYKVARKRCVDNVCMKGIRLSSDRRT